MKILTTRIHGVIDYVVGVLLILAPYLLGFATGGIEQILPQVLGAGTIVYSLLTQYELGIVKAIPMPGHLVLDFLAGALLALSPWMFDFSEVVYLPHLLVGLLEIGAVFITQTAPASTASIASPRAR